MKLTTINLLRGGVFSLAVVAAFAFTQPMPSFTTAWGDDPVLGPKLVTITQTSTYTCDDDEQIPCLYEDEELMNPIPEGPEGQFSYVGPPSR